MPETDKARLTSIKSKVKIFSTQFLHHQNSKFPTLLIEIRHSEFDQHEIQPWRKFRFSFCPGHGKRRFFEPELATWLFFRPGNRSCQFTSQISTCQQQVEVYR